MAAALPPWPRPRSARPRQIQRRRIAIAGAVAVTTMVFLLGSGSVKTRQDTIGQSAVSSFAGEKELVLTKRPRRELMLSGGGAAGTSGAPSSQVGSTGLPGSGVVGGSSNYMGLAHVAQVTEPAPDFEGTAVMPGGAFKKLSLADFKGQWLVLVFYPLDFTFVCPTELTAFSDKMSEFRDLGAAVVGISVDSQFTHLQWTKTSRKEGGVGPLEYPLLSDLTKSIGEAYGCMHSDGHHVRGTFIIDPNGIVRHITLNDPPVGRNVDEILRLIRGYQFADKHGEVCPAGWRPGGKTIKPNPTDKAAYFGSLGGSNNGAE